MSNYHRSSRRSRWTVQLAGHETPVVILAYSAANARDYYERRGKTVVKITKGDFRKKTRTPATPTRQRFVIDNAMVEEAKDMLGIKLPVKIRLHNRRGPTHGNYRFRGGRHHDIMLKRYCTAEQANETLWHELTHAMQAESQDGYDGWLTFDKAQRRYPYSRRPIEVEAREMAEQMKDIKLVKEAS